MDFEVYGKGECCWKCGRIPKKIACLIWKVLLTSEGSDLGTVSLKRSIFKGVASITVCHMLPLTFILRKMSADYKVSKRGKSIDHSLFMDDPKRYESTEDQLDALIHCVRIFSQDPGCRNQYVGCYSDYV